MKAVLLKGILASAILAMGVSHSYAQYDYGHEYGREAGYREEFENFENVDREFEVWCTRRLRDLDLNRRKASLETLRGNYSKAVDILLKGLSTAPQVNFGKVNPATLNLMTHSYNVGAALIKNVGTEVRGLKATAIALEAFYDLIKDTAYSIDYRYYRSNCGYCNSRNSRQFEQDVLDMVHNMMLIVNENLTVKRNGTLTALGSTKAYLTVTEVVATAGYHELRNLIYADAYACEILDLKDLSVRLKSFNSVASSEVAKKYEFIDSYYEMERLMDMINSNYSCFGRY